MEEEEEDMSSPFWLQASDGRRSSSSFLFNSGALLIFLLAIAVAFIFIIIPSIQSFTSQIFRPQSVKKSWDSLNLVLVLFAIICGFLSRNTGNNETTATSTTTYEDYKFGNRSESFPKSNPESETPRRFWYDHAHSNSNNIKNNNGGLSRLRSFSSHPDLRQEEALWVNREDEWRFYDDTHLYNNRFSSFDYHHQQQQLHQWRLRPKLEIEEDKEIKENERVDVVTVKNVDADTTTSSVGESQKGIIYTPPSPPPPPLPRRRVKRTNQENGKNRNHRSNDLEANPPSSLATTRRRPPPQQPETAVEEGGAKNEKKRGGTRATKEFLTSLGRKKKNKQRQKSVENLDNFFNYESSYPLPPSLLPPPSTSPSPPPPPPPPPFFHNLFSPKKLKAKKIHSVIPSPPPPPPPLRTQKLSTSASVPKFVTRNAPPTTQKPPLPVRIKSYNSNADENSNSGNESPLNAIPPPPPLPPFKMPLWKFEVQGDCVRLKSNLGDEVEEEESLSSLSAMEGGDSPAATPLFCPSPDVNTKADNFIARFRAGLRLEKMNSVKGRSNLGPEPSPSHEGE